MVDAHFLTQVRIFSSLAPDDLCEVAALWRSVSWEDGQILGWQGDRSKAMRLVREGKVEIFVRAEDNREVVVRVLRAGDFFNDTLPEGSPRTATARAVGRVELLEMGMDEWFVFLRRKPEIAISIMSEAANMATEHRGTRNEG